MRNPRELLESMLEKQKTNVELIQQLQTELKDRNDLQLRLAGAIEALSLLLSDESTEQA